MQRSRSQTRDWLHRGARSCRLLSKSPVRIKPSLFREVPPSPRETPSEIWLPESDTWVSPSSLRVTPRTPVTSPGVRDTLIQLVELTQDVMSNMECYVQEVKNEINVNEEYVHIKIRIEYNILCETCKVNHRENNEACPLAAQRQ